jgi:hypothetical protein
MRNAELAFVIPTYRLRDVGETVEQYDENFWRNGHATRITVFDDSNLGVQEKYYPLLEETRTFNELFYVGPREKEEFLRFLSHRLKDRKLDLIVRNLFRPSYGGNRNFTLIYTLGQLMVSSDDDMRPYALVEDSPESLNDGEVCRGRLVKVGANGYSRRSFDILTAFREVLGKPAGEVPPNYERGEYLVDSAMELETNASTGIQRENSLRLEPGRVPRSAIVKVAQTYRSGTNDIDAIDYLDLFLADEQQSRIEDLNDLYVLVNFRPVVTKKNWRIDCGVAGYDNLHGLPPFFPTRLRFEDFIYRLWVQHRSVASAHVDSAQTHTKNNYMRNPPTAEIFNEEICNLLKRKIKESVSKIDELTVRFDYEGEVTADDADAILTKISKLRSRAVAAAEAARKSGADERADELHLFSANLERAFYGFEPDFFQQNVARLVDDVVSLIQASVELWPTLVEICYFEKARRELPQVRVRNKRKGG